jgi:hypothetical protein
VAAGLAALTVWSASCSTPPPRPATVNPGTASHASAPAPAGPYLKACFGTVPADWTRALRSRSVTSPAGIAFGPGAVAAGAAFGQFSSATASGIGRLDLTTGKLTRISLYGPGAGGMGAIAVDAPWLVWEQLDSQTDLADWSIHVWNLVTRTGSVLARSPLAGGHHIAGQQPLPVVANATAAWAQPVPGSSGPGKAQIRVADLRTGRTRTLDTGRVSSPVYAGPYLVWATIDGSGRYQFRAVDAATLRPVQVPAILREPGTIGYLAGSPDYLAWSTQDLTSLTVWQVGSGRSVRLVPADARHHFQFLQLAGHFLLWYNGTSSSVMDLRTGAGFDLRGEVAGSPGAVVIARSVAAQAAKGGSAGSRVSTLKLTEATGIGGCGKAAAR